MPWLDEIEQINEVDDRKTYSRNEILVKVCDICDGFERVKHDFEWFHNGKNSVRVRFRTGKEFIFTYNSSDDWKIESVGSFLNGLNSKNN